MERRWKAATAAIAVGALCLASAGAAANAGTTGKQADKQQVSKLTDRQKLARIALPAGVQMAQKHTKRPMVKWHGHTVNSANPYLANVPRPASIDYSWWSRYLQRKGAQKALPWGKAAFVYDEQEPGGTHGSNDTQSNSEDIVDFGHAPNNPVVRIHGELSPPDVEADALTTEEDNGSIPLATETGIPADTRAVEVDSTIGDGPYGSEGTDSGDFDFYQVTAEAGEVIHASTLDSVGLDTIVVVYDDEGTLLALDDDSGAALQSDLLFAVPAAGDYFVMVTGFLSLPEDPFDSSSGLGSGDEGDYNLDLSVGLTDTDFYGVYLQSGDVLGGTVKGEAADMVVHRYDGEPRVGTFQDASFIYPIETPLPGGGNADFAYVAEEAGWYAVSTSQGDGEYTMQLEVYRPGSESGSSKIKQTIFLDFDGARVNTAVFGGNGVSTLSPLSAFMGRWGLPSSALNAVIDQIVATVRENVRADVKAMGLNGAYKIRILNSRDNADPFGQPNVSRVIVGGTIDQSGVFTIGVAQSIDPGNYGHQETALVLLDILSEADNPDDASLNFYIDDTSDVVKFVGTAVGNVTSHEIGHYLGSFHVDQFNDVLNLMDQGGNFPLLYGVGDDGIGGTADDPDVDFGVDTYNPNEGFTGFEDTLNTTAWSSAQ